MQCFSPLIAFKTKDGGLTFAPSLGKGEFQQFKLGAESMVLPCGQCLGCRLKRSQEWATRVVHEAQMHDDQNAFITLTYQEAPDGLVKQHFTAFMKKLRKSVYPKKIRFFMCGEYGKVYPNNDYSSPPLPHPFSDGREALGRPHYHAIIFGHDFGMNDPQKKGLEVHSVKRGHTLYRCEKLEKLWKHGFVTVGTVTHESAAYVARYCVKKINGEAASEYYIRVNEQGIPHKVIPEYINMSRRPGIGETWFQKYQPGEFGDVFPRDELEVTGGKRVPVPKYYVNLYKERYPEAFERVQERRIVKAKKKLQENLPDRLRSRRLVTEAKVSKLKRGLSE